MKKKIISTVICCICLVGVFLAYSYIQKENSKKQVSYVLNCSNVKHYSMNSMIKSEGVDFKYIGYKFLSDNEVSLEIDIDKKNYNKLKDGFTFKLANDDTLLLETDCSYENGTVNVINLKSDNREFNQIVISSNADFNIIAVLLLDNEK